MKQDDIFPGFATSLEMILKQGAQKLLPSLQEKKEKILSFLHAHWG